MEYNREKEKLCGVCQKPKDKQTFHSNPIKIGYMYMCKECCTNKFKEALAATGSDGAALWSVCMANDLPVIRKLYEAAVEMVNKPTIGAGRKPSLFLTYIALLKEDGKQYRGCYDSDMQLSDFIHIGTKDEIAEAKKCEADAAEQRKVWAKTWGSQYEDDEDYEWLDEQFNKYTCAIYDMEPAQESLYRELCKAQLKQFKGEGDKDVFAQIKTLMSMLKLDDFKENKQSDTEKFIDRWAWRLENESPAECADLEKYKDYAGNESMWKDILRTVKNAVSGSREYPEL